MCSNNTASAHVILKYVNQTKIKVGYQSGRKVVPQDSKSDLPLAIIKQAAFLKSAFVTVIEVSKKKANVWKADSARNIIGRRSSL